MEGGLVGGKMIVAIVVVPNYEGLAALMDAMPIWIVNTPFNRAQAKAIWKPNRRSDAFRGITLYNVSSPDALERNGINILEMVDLHHGIYSSGAPISTLKIIGTGLTPAFQEALALYDFVSFEESEGGFLAHIASVAE